MNIETLADHLQKAYDTGQPVQPLIELEPDMTIHDAYLVQLETVKRWEAAGKKITGKKIGLTSKAVQENLGVDEPDYGHLFDDMVVENGGSLSVDKVLQPKIEGEIAFVLKKDLMGPNVTAFDVLDATDYVLPALEIVGCRIEDWKIKIQDTVADNGSSAFYVLGGKPTKISDIQDLKLVGMNLYRNGELYNTGVGAATLGDPAIGVAWLANKLSDYGIRLKAGEVILSGALSGMIPVEAGDSFRAKFSDLGEVSVQFNS